MELPINTMKKKFKIIVDKAELIAQHKYSKHK